MTTKIQTSHFLFYRKNIPFIKLFYIRVLYSRFFYYSSKISPKKTVEGLAGGVVTNVVFSMLIGYGYQLIFAGGGRVNLWLIAIIAFFAAFAGALGDLTASVLKRECGIKDYGKIMPGHGGVLDRFDSVFMTAPLTYLFVETFGAYFPIIIR